MSKFNFRNIIIGLVLFGAAFAVVGSLSVIGWEYSNSDEFCGNACHQVHPQEPLAHQLSQHANVQCVECHVGRMNFFQSAWEKSGHVAHAWSLMVGYERPTYSTSFKSANSCESCHPKTTHRKNSIAVINHFDDDRDNTARKITLVMRQTGRNFGGGESLGINWHASGAVRYAASDPQGLEITRVEATLPDGEVRVYNNVRNASGASDTTEGEDDLKTMDCATCHNRVGHPFPNPEEAIELALSDGRISTELPYIKRHLDELLNSEFHTEAEARVRVEEAVDEYLATYPDLQIPGVPPADNRNYLLAGDNRLVDLMVRSRFLEDKNIDWRSFPDHTGHSDGPGCFRCHNGQLQTAQGTPIPVNCTTCHGIPVVSTGDRIPAHITELIDMEPPEYHLDPAFIAKHMELEDDTCEDCHGEIEYGDDDQSHCSNSGCHDSDWKYLDFDALSGANPR